MKSILTAVILLGVINFGFAQETKDEKDGLLSTRLEVSVVDDLGKTIEQAVVKGYATKEDYRNDTNILFEGSTNEKGKVTFKDLKPQVYFLNVQKGSMNNNGMAVSTEEGLEKGKLSKVTIVIGG